MGMLIKVNVRAGHDSDMWKKVKELFSHEKDVIRRVSELSDVYVVSEDMARIAAAVKKLQVDPGVIDINVALFESKKSLNRAVNTNKPVYMVLIDVERGTEDTVLTRLEGISSDSLEVLSTAVVYSYQEDLVSLIVSDEKNYEIADKIRAIPGVRDTTIYTLRD